MEYQLKNDYLKKFEDNNLSVNWTTILIGLKGPGKFEGKLSIGDVTNYAISKIEQNSSQCEEVLILAGLNEEDSELVYKYVKNLADGEDKDKEVELRKWIVILLKDVINTINPDPLNGLIQFTEFWEKFDYPKFSPHIIQGINNTITPKEYYTPENFKRIVNLHDLWVKKEKEKLSSS
jgi:hypothetical protein